MTIDTILKQPLFQFAVIGLVLFVLNGFVNSSEANNQEEIVINELTRKTLIQRFEKQWKMQPTDQEYNNLINDYIKQEIFYREALKLELDKNDEIIKRRLYQKMEVLLKDFEPKAMAYDSVQVHEFYANNIENYSTPELYSFYQIGIEDKEKALELLNRLNEETDISAKEQKEMNSIDLFPFYIADITPKQMESKFGGTLSEDITKTKTKVWSGPFRSGFGWHLIYLTDKIPSRPIEFQNAKHNVVNDMQYMIEKENQEKLYNELRKKYQIIEQ